MKNSGSLGRRVSSSILREKSGHVRQFDPLEPNRRISREICLCQSGKLGTNYESMPEFFRTWQI